MLLCGWQHPKTVMGTLVIIESNVPAKASACLCYVLVALFPVHDFCLYRPVDTFRYGIVCRLVVFCHADTDMIFVQLTDICITAVLYASV